MGAITLGGAGALGGPLTAAAGAGLGTVGGQMLAGEADLKDAEDKLKEAEETIDALSEGDVQKLIKIHGSDTASKFESFVNTIKKILIGAAILLGLYLIIPIFVAKKCASKEAERRSTTRPPFPSDKRKE